MRTKRHSAKTVSIPRTGYFAIGPDGKLRPGVKAKLKHEIPAAPAIDPEAPTSRFCGAEQPKPFKRILVAALAKLRDAGPQSARDCGALLADGAWEWLEGNGLMRAVSAVHDHPVFYEVIYEISQDGLEFLRQHEAPESWS